MPEDNTAHHSQAVKAAAKALNEAITEATEFGLEVKLSTQDVDAGKATKPQVVVKVWQEV